jgi:hypothetical protein
VIYFLKQFRLKLTKRENNTRNKTHKSRKTGFFFKASSAKNFHMSCSHRPLSATAGAVAISAFILLTLSLAAHAAVAGDCARLDLPDTFYMVAGAAGDYTQDTYPLYFSSQPEPGTVSSTNLPNVQLYCQDEAKSFSIYNKSGTVGAYSNNVGGTGFPAVKVNSACVSETLFNVRLGEDFRYVLTNASGACVAVAQDTPSNLVRLVSCTNASDVLSTAALTWSEKPIRTPEGNFKFSAYWTAQRVDAATPNMYLVTMMAVKINNGMQCNPATNPPSTPPAPSGLSSGAVIVIAVLISGFLAVGVYLGLRHFYKRVDYAELRHAMNENHES